MKRLAALAGLLLAIALPPARAQQNPDDQYVAIYNLMQQADSLAAAGQLRQALAEFTQARDALEKFQKDFPDWSQKIVSFRLNYLTKRINDLTAPFPATNAPSPPAADVQTQLNALRAQVQSLQADNQTLQAKLQEALSTQPAAADAAELAKARAQVRLLMKENELLKAELAQSKAGMGRAPAAAPESGPAKLDPAKAPAEKSTPANPQ